MIQFFDNPSQAVEAARERLGTCQQLDVLTGFIGARASRLLESLEPQRTRIVFGLARTVRALPPRQLRELEQLRGLPEAEVRVYPGLHAKLYLFDRRIMAVGSANLTRAGFEWLQEAMLVTDAPQAVRRAMGLFERVWKKAIAPPRRRGPVARGRGEDGVVMALGRRPDPERSAFSAPRKRLRRSERLAHGGESSSADRSLPRVRICAYRAERLEGEDGFEGEKVLPGWSTGESAQPGDLQLFCISKDVRGAPELAGDPRVDAVHSLWRMAGPIDPALGNDDWPVQAPFELVVRFENPIPYRDMLRARLVSDYGWPMGWRGKLLRTKQEVERLGNLLARRNPRQRGRIRRALGLR